MLNGSAQTLMCTSRPSSVIFPDRGRLLSNQNSGCITVKRTDMKIMGTESNAMKRPSFDDRGPLKPPLSSATRQQERMKRQTAATAAPGIGKDETLDHGITSQRRDIMPLTKNVSQLFVFGKLFVYFEAYYSEKKAEYCREQDLCCEACNHKIDSYGIRIEYCGKRASTADEAKAYKIAKDE